MTALDLTTEQDAPTSPGFLAYAEAMAQGPCLCAEIAEDDRPCLTCEAQAVLAQRGACEDCDGDGKVRDPAPDALAQRGACEDCDGDGKVRDPAPDALAQRGACEDCDGDGKVRDPAPDAPGALPTTRCLTCAGGAS